MTTTFERLRALLIKDYHFAPVSLTLEAPLEELGIDSLGVASPLGNSASELLAPPAPGTAASRRAP